MRTKVLPVVLLAALLGGGLSACTEPGGATAPTSTTPSSGTTPAPTSAEPGPTATPEVDAPATGDDGDPTAPAADPGTAGPGDGDAAPDEGDGAGAAPVPVPADQADGWTDETAYRACSSLASSVEGPDHSWSPRTGQRLVLQDGRRTLDVAGVYTGGDVGVANVTWRCVVGGTPSAPALSGSLVR